MTINEWKSLLYSLPEGLSFKEASDRLGKPYQQVRFAAIRVGYQAKDGRGKSNRRKFEPDKADWTKSNQEIAREQNCSRELVRRWRKRLGKPFIESRGRRRKPN